MTLAGLGLVILAGWFLIGFDLIQQMFDNGLHAPAEAALSPGELTLVKVLYAAATLCLAGVDAMLF